MIIITAKNFTQKGGHGKSEKKKKGIKERSASGTPVPNTPTTHRHGRGEPQDNAKASMVPWGSAEWRSARSGWAFGRLQWTDLFWLTSWRRRKPVEGTPGRVKAPWRNSTAPTFFRCLHYIPDLVWYCPGYQYNCSILSGTSSGCQLAFSFVIVWFLEYWIIIIEVLNLSKGNLS